MNEELRKLLENPALGVVRRNVDERFRRSGLRLKGELGPPADRKQPQDDNSPKRAASAHG
jgi:hypothetical protein